MTMGKDLDKSDVVKACEKSDLDDELMVTFTSVRPSSLFYLYTFIYFFIFHENSIDHIPRSFFFLPSNF